MDRVVIYRLGSLGDTVVSLPCFHLIARKFPTSERIVLTNYPVANNAPALLEVLQGSGLIHRTVEYPVGLRSAGRMLQLKKKLRSLNTDTLIYLAAPRGLTAILRDIAFFRFSGFKNIIGAPISAKLRTNTIDPQNGEQEPEYSRLARTLEDLGPANVDDPQSWSLQISQTENDEAQAFLEPIRGAPFIAINMGGKVEQKDWGVENWLSLASGLCRAYPGLGLLIIGAREDRARGDLVAASWRGPSLNLSGLLSPRQAAAAIGYAAFFIGHDSGPMHLASAMGVKCIGIFGEYNLPRKWYPWGAGHQILHATEIKAITVSQVEEASERLMSGQAVQTN